MVVDAAVLLDPAQVGLRQAVVLGGVLACRLKTVLRDGGADLLALTVIRSVLRETWCREHRDEGYDWETAHVFKTHVKESLKKPKLRTRARDERPGWTKASTDPDYVGHWAVARPAPGIEAGASAPAGGFDGPEFGIR